MAGAAGKLKQPYEIRIPGEEGGPCYATITTEPTAAFSKIHDRLLAIVGFDEGLAFLQGRKSTFAPFAGALEVTPCESPLKRRKPKPDDPQGQLF